ncbi:hypothetical protein DS884_16840 [Tenacibaculum sp. E3R01]|uniref:hypothetical protein n=1 Tax=Tenacibaculum sp. E3R01 TaxID=2267227 RepID=UPI000DE97CF6|nr:hypothetical protein [Tenacibaculum sp. E3R01]RBW55295.1 hypothetical protein DS884_16840 [Tenacibaculum sp. E3R01]
MKKLLLISLITLTTSSFSQNDKAHPFFTGSLSTTFGINQQYKINEEGNGPFIVPKSILLRTGFGYQFNKRWASSINVGYDHHFSYAINSIPAFASLRYNFIRNSSDAYFIETSYGQMFRLSKKFSNGNYYKVGLGMLSISNNRWNGLLRLDFHRKKIAGFKNGNLDSVSIGFGFSFN